MKLIVDSGGAVKILSSVFKATCFFKSCYTHSTDMVFGKNISCSQCHCHRLSPFP